MERSASSRLFRRPGQADGWQVELVRVEYDIKREQAGLAEQRPPKWKNLSRALDGELFLG